jgi:hypothetical protein
MNLLGSPYGRYGRAGLQKFKLIACPIADIGISSPTVSYVATIAINSVPGLDKELTVMSLLSRVCNPAVGYAQGCALQDVE